jgi:hypothetical protein
MRAARDAGAKAADTKADEQCCNGPQDGLAHGEGRAPRSVNSGARTPAPVASDNLTELEDRQVHGNHQSADHHTQEHDDERLEQA